LGSLLSAVVGYLLLRFAPVPPALEPAPDPRTDAP
jgi:Na+:H+ antiporter, NhaA family